MEGLPQRVVRDTTAGIPDATVIFIDWIIDGTVPEDKIDLMFKRLEALVVEAGGSIGSSVGGAAGVALSSALYLSGIKQKILNMGNGDSVHDLARLAVQNNGNDAQKAIDSIIGEREKGGQQLNQLLREVLAAAVRLLPGATETSLVMGVVRRGFNTMGYDGFEDKVSIMVAIITRYPDRVYNYLRRVFALASLHGHDISRRGTQAEIFAHAVPMLMNYFADISAGESPGPDTDPAAAVTVAGGTVAAAASISDTVSRDALQVAGYAAAAFGASTVVALTQSAQLAQIVYKGHKENTKEIEAWNVKSTEMLLQTSARLRIEPDILVDHAVKHLLGSISAMALPAVVGVWGDVERVIRGLLSNLDSSGTVFDSVLGVELFGIDPLTAATASVTVALYVMSVWMLYKNVGFFRYLSPSLLLSILFISRYLNTWFLAYSASSNFSKLLVSEKTSAIAGPPLIFMISALSSILKQSALVNFGRMLPFIFIIGFLFGYADATFHIVTIAIGKLGQMLLSTMVRERRGVQRKIVLWCFDDLLQAMSPVADSNITPDEKLELITPGIFACSLVRTLDEKKMLIFGAVLGAIKCLLPRFWPGMLLLELVVVLVMAAIAQNGLKYCWERWKVCLPEHVDRIDNLEMIWRAYLQNKPEFALKAAPSSNGYGISIVLQRPWVMNATEYKLFYRKSVSFLATANDWVEHASPVATNEAAFIKHIEGEDNRIMLQELDMGAIYEVRVDALGETPQPMGIVRRCCTGTPVVQASVKAPTKIEVRTSSPITSDVTYYIRCRRGASTLWPWRYRDGFNPLTAELLVLDEHGVCVIAELTAGVAYEIQVRVRDEGTGTDWLPVSPNLVQLPAPEGTAPAVPTTVEAAATTPANAVPENAAAANTITAASSDGDVDGESNATSENGAVVAFGAPAAKAGRQAKVLFNFEAEKSHELAVNQGDVITILEVVDENWVRAELDGKSGIVPESYIKDT